GIIMSDKQTDNLFDELSDSQMSLGDHLDELRLRLIYCLIALALAGGLCLFFGWEIIAYLVEPLAAALAVNNLPPSLLATSLTGPFMTYMKVSLISGLFLASPYIFYQLWQFVAAGLLPSEKRLVRFFAPFSALLFILGGAFFIYIVAPISINFFLNFNSSLSVSTQPGGWYYSILDYQPDPASVNNEIVAQSQDPASPATIETLCSLNEYISFMLSLAVAFGLSFQMPLAVFLLGRLNLISLAGFCRFRRFMLLIIVIFAALVTPPDVISQLALAFPMYALYELGIFLLKYFPGAKSQEL
ncbi:MAG: twin-arginine translocase subunit TatC, partial [Sedimentisphaerales bacterium]|nr:twin-arginine translocase subunit TatC [Sedimentisphaerales bacterium]